MFIFVECLLQYHNSVGFIFLYKLIPLQAHISDRVNGIQFSENIATVHKAYALFLGSWNQNRALSQVGYWKKWKMKKNL